MKSKRFEVLGNRPVNKDGYVKEWPEVGLIAMNSPLDPKPSIVIENGKVVEIYKNETGEYTGKIKENNFVFLEQNNDLTYSKERNSLAYFTLKFPDYEFSYHVWINIQKDGNLFLKGTGNTEVGKYVRELHLIRQK